MDMGCVDRHQKNVDIAREKNTNRQTTKDRANDNETAMGCALNAETLRLQTERQQTTRCPLSRFILVHYDNYLDLCGVPDFLSRRKHRERQRESGGEKKKVRKKQKERKRFTSCQERLFAGPLQPLVLTRPCSSFQYGIQPERCPAPALRVTQDQTRAETAKYKEKRDMQAD